MRTSVYWILKQPRLRKSIYRNIKEYRKSIISLESVLGQKEHTYNHDHPQINQSRGKLTILSEVREISGFPGICRVLCEPQELLTARRSKRDTLIVTSNTHRSPAWTLLSLRSDFTLLSTRLRRDVIPRPYGIARFHISEKTKCERGEPCPISSWQTHKNPLPFPVCTFDVSWTRRRICSAENGIRASVIANKLWAGNYWGKNLWRK